MTTPQTPRQISEQERRKEIKSAHEDRMASFRKSEEAARLRRENAGDTASTPPAPASSEPIADVDAVKPVRRTSKTRT